MDQEEYQNNIIAIANHYDYESQSRQLIEEMAELTQAINKYWRKQLECGKKDFEIKPIFLDDKVLIMSTEYDNLVEELADVQIMISQMVYLLRTDIEPIIEQKLNRQLERIEKNE